MQSPVIKLHPCSTFTLAGSTYSGKTTWIFNFLRNSKAMFLNSPPEKIYYCYGVWTDTYSLMEREIKNIVFYEGIPSQDTLEKWTKGSNHTLLILDDLAHAAVQSQDVELLFTRLAHHKKMSVFFISQNIFQQGKSARTISLNTFYTVLFRNGRDRSQIATLGRQMFPGRGEILLEAFEDATQEPFSYLFVDASPMADSQYRLRTNIFPGEDMTVYVPKT